MTILKISAKTTDQQIKRYFESLRKTMRAAAVRGIRGGARKCLPLMHQWTRQAIPTNTGPFARFGAVDTGRFLRKWKVVPIPGLGARILNDSEYASEIEHGRQPGSMPPTRVIEQWLIRRAVWTPVTESKRRVSNQFIPRKPRMGSWQRRQFDSVVWMIRAAIAKKGIAMSNNPPGRSIINNKEHVEVVKQVVREGIRVEIVIALIKRESMSGPSVSDRPDPDIASPILYWMTDP